MFDAFRRKRAMRHLRLFLRILPDGPERDAYVDAILRAESELNTPEFDINDCDLSNVILLQEEREKRRDHAIL